MEKDGPMLVNDGYALLIGVGDYSRFDASRPQADAASSDLPGSRNDATTFWRLCRLLGMKAENIRVLASPPFDSALIAEFEGARIENFGAADERGILDGVRWLSEMLGQASKPTGLLTYSGHGDVTPKQGLVLCPSDVEYAADDTLKHAISYSTINAIIAPNAENLTVVLDTCHAGGAAKGAVKSQTGRPLVLMPRTTAATKQVAPSGAAQEDLAGRVLAAAGRDQVAYQSMFDGRWRGVFSWAVSCAMEQWSMTQEGNTVRLDVSYDRLVETTQRLISALWFDQKPELRGAQGIGKLAVFHPGLDQHQGETTEMPDGGFKTEQVDPGMRDYVVYQILDQAGVLLGQILVTNTAGAGYDANREYWYMTTNLSNSGTYTFVGGAAKYWSTPPSGLGTLSFKTVRTPTWTSGTPSGTMLLYTNALTGERIGINWGMTVSHGSWGGSIVWWHSTTGNLFGPGTSTTLTSGTPASGTWYSFTTTPL